MSNGEWAMRLLPSHPIGRKDRPCLKKLKHFAPDSASALDKNRQSLMTAGLETGAQDSRSGDRSYDFQRPRLAGFGDLLDGDGIEEGHGGAEGFSDDLDGVLGFLLAVGVELLSAGGLVF